ncbi:hypothetical protein BV394_04085 [Brevirhabdus pacifica]|uniref:Chitooligosaccharide deacetylase n=1 Tax=Brevirhabdus pacifica TaxID=1267768 RepID=A0A1U7DGB1_9RHOB|nr:polysaccharide deacetylase family protein [Brevirhabdus pacifica]APX89006.1 hypothetical protein BV394_04085 [Brevirhabdus pacifica]OWU80222.1 hypothetical protein ATO5_04765 [Loktanella sp. 22II-4b]PJJ86428.1 polysaccharide deacetylase [Brevirhabdus pacifica]
MGNPLHLLPGAAQSAAPDPAACRPEDRHPTDRAPLRRRRVLGWLGWVVAAPLLLVALGWVLGAGVWALLPALAWAGLAALVLHPSMILPGGVPVLTYHSVSRQPGWLPWARQISIRPEVLDRQMGQLGRMGVTVIDDAELMRMRRFGAALPDNLAVLHFDDGYLDNRVAAWPILRRHGLRATLFVSIDFVDPAPGLRPTMEDSATPRWDGYLRWDELREMEASGVFTIEAHGTDHARVETGAAVLETLTAGNWKRLAWKQWAADQGPKHDWYLAAAPAIVSLGAPVRRSAPALAARAWRPDGSSPQNLETPAEYAARVTKVFARCQQVFRAELGRPARIFCWPQNVASAAAHDIAVKAGFVATTGARERNTPHEPTERISRIHIGQDWIGLRCPLADDLGFRATLRCFQGNLYWGLVLLALGGIRRAVTAGQRLTAPLRRSRPHDMAAPSSAPSRTLAKTGPTP